MSSSDVPDGADQPIAHSLVNEACSSDGRNDIPGSLPSPVADIEPLCVGASFNGRRSCQLPCQCCPQKTDVPSSDAEAEGFDFLQPPRPQLVLLRDPEVGAPPQQWLCKVCTLENLEPLQACGACGTERAPGSPKPEAEEKWKCSTCTLENTGDARQCTACGTLRTASAGVRLIRFQDAQPDQPPASPERDGDAAPSSAAAAPAKGLEKIAPAVVASAAPAASEEAAAKAPNPPTAPTAGASSKAAVASPKAGRVSAPPPLSAGLSSGEEKGKTQKGKQQQDGGDRSPSTSNVRSPKSARSPKSNKSSEPQSPKSTYSALGLEWLDDDDEEEGRRKMVKVLVPPELKADESRPILCKFNQKVLITGFQFNHLSCRDDELALTGVVDDTEKWILRDAGNGTVFIVNQQFKFLQDSHGELALDAETGPAWTFTDAGSDNIYIASQDGRYLRDDGYIPGLGREEDDAATWTITLAEDGQSACQVEENKDTPTARLEELVERTSKLPYRMKTKGNVLRKFKAESIAVHDIVARYAASTNAIMHPRAANLLKDFLEYKKEYGTEIEQQIMNDAYDVFGLLHRLLRLRPLVFNLAGDKYYLPDGKTRGYGAGGPGFDSIGTEDEVAPLVMESLISYDEMELSALLGMSGPTHFIHSGATSKTGVGERDEGGQKDPYERQGFCVGLVPPRFEKPSKMEFKHMLVMPDQNIPTNGYGKDSRKNRLVPNPLLQLWAKFYGVDHFPNMAEVLKDMKAGGTRYMKFPEGKLDGGYFDTLVYAKRFEMIAEMFLGEADTRAKSVDAQAVCHIVPLQLGAWIWEEIETQIQVDAYSIVLRRMKFANIGEMHFSGFKVKQTQGGPSVSELADDGGRCVQLFFAERNPADKLEDPKAREDERWLLVCMYGWNSNSYPGNEYWENEFESSGAATACCSFLPELQNPDVNSEAIAGSQVHVVPRPVGDPFYSAAAMHASLNPLSGPRLLLLAESDGIAEELVKRALESAAAGSEEQREAVMNLIAEVEKEKDLIRNPPPPPPPPTCCDLVVMCCVFIVKILRRIQEATLFYLEALISSIERCYVKGRERYNAVTQRIAAMLDRWVDMYEVRADQAAVEKALWEVAFEAGKMDEPPPERCQTCRKRRARVEVAEKEEDPEATPSSKSPKGSPKVSEGSKGSSKSSDKKSEREGSKGSSKSSDKKKNGQGGAPQPSPVSTVDFTDAEVMKAYHIARAKPLFILQVFRGQDVNIGFTIFARVLLAAFVTGLYFSLALLVYETPRDFAVDAVTGAMTNPSLEAQPALSVASTVGLRTLPEYTRLPLSELRMVEDVRFTHNMGTHTVRVASVARSASGTLRLTGVDGSTIRVEPDGQLYWALKNQYEERLQHTEHWRSAQNYDATSAWLLGGSFAVQASL